MNKTLPVICLAGPTGSGKTALALRLARTLACEIVNTDSRQVYADFPIITAQPTEEEQAAVPHHLYGFLPLTERMDAGHWSFLALAACRQILSRGKLPLLVGGTGFYFKALLAGLADIPAIDENISRELSRRLESAGLESLYAELTQVDARYAANIHPHDKQRILRALEVWLATGKTFSWWHEHSRPQPRAAGPLLVVNTRLGELEPRLASRIEAMLAAGAIKEAQTAWSKYENGGYPGWKGIGCAELLQFLQQKIDMDECRRLWLANTRAYAKRQITWFRGQKDAIWIDPSQPERVLKAVHPCLEKL